MSNTHVEVRPVIGRCVFADADFKSGELILTDEVIPVTYSKIKDSELEVYSMSWDDTHDAITLGHIQLLNHSDNPNCMIVDDFDNNRKRLYAKRDIAKGEHMTICYACDLWFEPMELGR